jgi:hypothetical protein
MMDMSPKTLKTHLLFLAASPFADYFLKKAGIYLMELPTIRLKYPFQQECFMSYTCAFCRRHPCGLASVSSDWGLSMTSLKGYKMVIF